MACWTGFKLFSERCSCKCEGSRNEPDLCRINVTSTFHWGGLFVPIIFVILLATLWTFHKPFCSLVSSRLSLSLWAKDLQDHLLSARATCMVAVTVVKMYYGVLMYS